MAFRRRLHKIGIEEFVEETLNAGTITAKKLCTAFGIMPPAFLEGCRDEAYHQLLVLGINREMNKRLKLNEYNSVEDAVELLKKSRNIIVLTGAGVRSNTNARTAGRCLRFGRFRQASVFLTFGPKILVCTRSSKDLG